MRLFKLSYPIVANKFSIENNRARVTTLQTISRADVVDNCPWNTVLITIPPWRPQIQDITPTHIKATVFHIPS